MARRTSRSSPNRLRRWDEPRRDGYASGMRSADDLVGQHRTPRSRVGRALRSCCVPWQVPLGDRHRSSAASRARANRRSTRSSRRLERGVLGSRRSEDGAATRARASSSRAGRGRSTQRRPRDSAAAGALIARARFARRGPCSRRKQRERGRRSPTIVMHRPHMATPALGRFVARRTRRSRCCASARRRFDAGARGA